jgi:hypothetical protein
MGVSLKTEQRRSHTAVAGFEPWVRRAEGYQETRQIKPSGQVSVNPRRPPSLPLIWELFADPSSFSVLRETPMAFFRDNFKQLKCYLLFLLRKDDWDLNHKGRPFADPAVHRDLSSHFLHDAVTDPKPEACSLAC